MNLTLDILDIILKHRKIKRIELYRTLSSKWSIYSVSKQLSELEKRKYIKLTIEDGEEYVEVGEKID